MRKMFAALLLAGVLLTPAAAVAAEKPKSVVHIVTVRWKEGATPEQIQSAMTALDTAAKSYPGLTRIWTRPLKVQGQALADCGPNYRGISHVIVMEFASEDALAKYANSDAQKTWYKTYLPLRDQSRTHDITN